MKRIDAKINEIEKKDKRNRLAYYIIVVLIIAFSFMQILWEIKLQN